MAWPTTRSWPTPTRRAAWLKSLPTSNGKVGIIGTCSGGRAAFMVAARSSSFDAVVDLWGGRVVMAQDALNAKTPVAPIDYTKDLNIPLLGLFGNDDASPSPAEVDQHEAALKQHGKNYEFHRYDGAGHGFFYYDRPMLPAAAGVGRLEQGLRLLRKEPGLGSTWAQEHRIAAGRVLKQNREATTGFAVLLCRPRCHGLQPVERHPTAERRHR